VCGWDLAFVAPTWPARWRTHCSTALVVTAAPPPSSRRRAMGRQFCTLHTKVTPGEHRRFSAICRRAVMRTSPSTPSPCHMVHPFCSVGVVRPDYDRVGSSPHRSSGTAEGLLGVGMWRRMACACTAASLAGGGGWSSGTPATHSGCSSTSQRGGGDSLGFSQRAAVVAVGCWLLATVPPSVGSVYAREKRKLDQTGLVPIINIWVVVVGVDCSQHTEVPACACWNWAVRRG
jgi:hypothetical protein